LLADEPFNNLDPKLIKTIKNLLLENIDKKDFNYSKSFNPNKIKTNREKLVIDNKLDIFESIYIKI